MCKNDVRQHRKFHKRECSNMEGESEDDCIPRPDFVYLDNHRNALSIHHQMWVATMHNQKIRKAANNLARLLAVAGLEDDSYARVILSFARKRAMADYLDRKEGHVLEYTHGTVNKKGRIDKGESCVVQGGFKNKSSKN